MIIENCKILTTDHDNQYKLIDGDIVIENEFISYIGKLPKSFSKKEHTILDGNGKLAIPGLINSHYHSHNNFLKGLGENLPLEPWIYYSAFAASVYQLEDVYANTMLGAIEMIRSGVTSVIDHMAYEPDGVEVAIKAYEDTGLRVAVAPLVSDLPYDETLPIKKAELPQKILKKMEEKPKCIEDIKQMYKSLINDWHEKNNQQITIMLGPSGPQRCSEELLIELYKLANEYDLGIHTHYLETKLQAITAFEKYDKTMSEYLQDLGILDNKWSLAHTVWVSDDDIDILSNAGATVVHNPMSNLRLGSGLSPVIDLKEKDISVGIGTDSCNCGGNVSMFQAMSLTANLSKITTNNYKDWLHSANVLQMATQESAEAMRLKDEIGSIEVGKQADIVLLDLNTTFLSPQINLINQLVYSELGQSVDTVIIQGKMVMNNKKLLTINEEKIMRLVKKRYEKIKDTIIESIKHSEDQIAYVEKVYQTWIDYDIGFNRSAVN